MSEFDNIAIDAFDTEVKQEVTTTAATNSGEAENVQVTFKPARTARHLPVAPDNVFDVPTKLSRLGCSTLLNSILELTPPTPFEFLINGKFLRTTLAKYLTDHELTAESVLELEYLEATPPPDRDQSTPQPDWVSSIDTCLGVLTTMLPDVEQTNKKLKAIAAGKPFKEDTVFTKQDSILSVVGCYDHLVRVWAHSLENNKDDAQKEQMNDDKKQFQKSSHQLLAQGAGHLGPVSSVRVLRPFVRSNPNQTSLVVSGSHDKTCRLWELTPPTPSEEESTKIVPRAAKMKCLGVFDYHVGSINCVEGLYHPNRPNSLIDHSQKNQDTVKFLSAGYDGVVSLWTNTSDYRLSQDHVEQQYELMNKGMGRKLKAQKIHAYQSAAKVTADVVDSELSLPHYRPITAYLGHKGAVSSVIWPNQRTFYTGGYDSTVRMWDFERSQYIHAWSGGHVVNCLDFSNPLNLIASGDQDGYVRLWDPRLPKGHAAQLGESDDEDEIRRLPTTKTNKGQLKACNSWVSSVKWTHNITNSPYYLFTTSYDGKAKMWDIRGSKPLYEIDTTSERLLCGDFVPTSAPADDAHSVEVYTVCGGTGKQIDRLHWTLNTQSTE